MLPSCRRRNSATATAKRRQSRPARRREAWPDEPSKAAQKDVDARWTLKIGGKIRYRPDGTPLPQIALPVFGYKSHIVIDRRFLIEEDLSQVKAEITALMERVRARRPTFRYEVRDLFEVVPSMTDRDAPIVRTTAAAIERVLGLQAGYVVSPGTYDQKHIDRIGKLHNCIAYGPGVLEMAHQPDEWIGVGDMLDSARVMGLVLADLLLVNR